MLKQNQNGRSMIEMLGVLAIIGVLSIGGIAGYSKAMNKYRVNKTADQISQLAQNIRTLYASQKNYSTLNENVIKKAHLAPEEMYENSNTLDMVNPYGGTFVVYPGLRDIHDSSSNKAFIFRLHGIPQAACIDLLTQDWGQGSSSGLIALGNEYASYSAFLGSCSDAMSYHCAQNGVMPITKAISICNQITSNILCWKFY